MLKFVSAGCPTNCEAGEPTLRDDGYPVILCSACGRNWTYYENTIGWSADDDPDDGWEEEFNETF